MLADGFGHPTVPYYALKRTYEPSHVPLALPEILWAPSELIPLKAKVTHAGPAALAGHTVRVRWHQSSSPERLEEAASHHDRRWPVGWPSEPRACSRSPTFAGAFFFVTAELRNAQGTLVSRSVYWPRPAVVLENQQPP